jgi:Protein of unknown function (DUF3592)
MLFAEIAGYCKVRPTKMQPSAARSFQPHSLLILVWAMLLAPLLYYTADTFVGLWKTAESKHWSSIQGKVMAHEIRGRGYCYNAYVRYEYKVDANSWSSDKRVLGPEECFSKQLVVEMVNVLPIGSRVRVYYDEKSPDRAVLLPGYITRNGWIGAFFLPSATIGWMLVGWLVLRSWRPSKSVASSVSK